MFIPEPLYFFGAGPAIIRSRTGNFYPRTFQTPLIKALSMVYTFMRKTNQRVLKFHTRHSVAPWALQPDEESRLRAFTEMHGTQARSEK